MNYFKKSSKLLLGLGTVSGIAGYVILNKKDKVAFNSWTTNYTPPENARWDDNWDRRLITQVKQPRGSRHARDSNNNEIEQPKPKFTRHIIMIRHGQYKPADSDENRVLTQLGATQAAYTASRLKAMKIPITEIVMSTMTRARETGQIIAESFPDVPVSHCSLLREGAPIPPEPPVGDYKPEHYQFYKDGSRIEAAFRKYFYRADPSQEGDSFTVLVCHANVIRYFVCRALQFPAEGWLRMGLYNGSITWISIAPTGKVVLRSLSDFGFLPPECITVS